MAAVLEASLSQALQASTDACELPKLHQRKEGRSESEGSASTASSIAVCEQSSESELDTSKVRSGLSLSTLMEAVEIGTWQPDRFEMEAKLMDAPRNHGSVLRMFDTLDSGYVAVKQMPRDWVCSSHAEFVQQHSEETERPWVDFACLKFLSGIRYPYTCRLVGIFSDESYTNMVMGLASEGDLFSWSSDLDVDPGPEREELCRPIAFQVLDAVRHLHDLGLVHRDISAENILLHGEGERDELKVQLIDFGMCTPCRLSQGLPRGKPSYQAPEVHGGEAYDGFLSDTFSTGVVLYMLLMQQYPWLSTKPGGCKAFEFYSRRGMPALLGKHKHPRFKTPMVQHTTEPLISLLARLLATDPAERLSLGEHAFLEEPDRGSVWQEPWVHGTDPQDT